MKASFFLAISFVFLVSGCSSISEIPASPVEAKVDSFDSKRLTVSVESIFGYGNNVASILNLRWNSDQPDIQIDAIIPVIDNVSKLTINADGDVFEVRPCSRLTNYSSDIYSPSLMTGQVSFVEMPWSHRTFCLSVEQYQKISKSHLVKTKISTMSKYWVASFSPTGSTEVNNAAAHVKAFGDFSKALRANGGLK
ncbi:hypothetical protein P0W48_16525 [Plesiomonas shigelloides]|uniref:hypothetical protein n=1 Tax=Plesiomonas shigelloides TaxID=703 RepID=UPI0010583811|nr:hypothetical protein [Plesiomonas shigelloides]